jgi:SM-20-related protein
LSAVIALPSLSENQFFDEVIFNQIAEDLVKQGFSISHNGIPAVLAESLFEHQQNLANEKFKNAGIGRGDDYIKKESIRTDEICWINGESNTGKQWLEWTGELKKHLNRRLFLGLFSFESHFAHYSPGDYYKRHYDAFKGETNRILSLVVYFNKDWAADDGGELVLYQNNRDKQGIKIFPEWGTVVTFLSEDFPHEVLPANRDRHSIAGWFRVNSSTTAKVDPPL